MCCIKAINITSVNITVLEYIYLFIRLVFNAILNNISLTVYITADTRHRKYSVSTIIRRLLAILLTYGQWGSSQHELDLNSERLPWWDSWTTTLYYCGKWLSSRGPSRIIVRLPRNVTNLNYIFLCMCIDYTCSSFGHPNLHLAIFNQKLIYLF